MQTISDLIVKKTIIKLIKSEDYRSEIVMLIDATFLQFVIDFFQKIVNAKLANKSVTSDWYKAEFLNPTLSSKELIINSGLNQKTVANMRNSANRQTVLETTTQHYEQLYQTINELIERGTDIDVTLTIKFNGVSIDLNINESLVVINTLAVKRAELRGGAWSSVGKRAEKILMKTLCRLYEVPDQNTLQTGFSDESREIDFYLLEESGVRYQCEVKLMGKGNPESADVTFARKTEVFVADKLSEKIKKQLDNRKVKWLELREPFGYRKFPLILRELNIPYSNFDGDLDVCLNEILDDLLKLQKLR